MKITKESRTSDLHVELIFRPAFVDEKYFFVNNPYYLSRPKKREEISVSADESGESCDDNENDEHVEEGEIGLKHPRSDKRDFDAATKRREGSKKTPVNSYWADHYWIALDTSDFYLKNPITRCPFIEYSSVVMVTKLKASSSRPRGDGKFLPSGKYPVCKLMHISKCRKAFDDGMLPKQSVTRYFKCNTSFNEFSLKNFFRTVPKVVTSQDQLKAKTAGITNHISRVFADFFKDDKHVELLPHFSTYGIRALSPKNQTVLADVLKLSPHVFCFPSLRDAVLLKRGDGMGYPWQPLFAPLEGGKPLSWLKEVMAEMGKGHQYPHVLESAVAEYERIVRTAVYSGDTVFKSGGDMCSLLTAGRIFAACGKEGFVELPFYASLEDSVCASIYKLNMCHVFGQGVQLYHVESSASRGKVLISDVMLGNPKGLVILSANSDTTFDLRRQTGMDVWCVFAPASLSPDHLSAASTLVVDSCHLLGLVDFKDICETLITAQASTSFSSRLFRLILLGDAHDPVGARARGPGFVFRDMWNSGVFKMDAQTFSRAFAADEVSTLSNLREAASKNSSRSAVGIVTVVIGPIYHLDTPDLAAEFEDELKLFVQKTSKHRLECQAACDGWKLSWSMSKFMARARSNSILHQGRFACGDKVLIQDTAQVGIVSAIYLGRMKVLGRDLSVTVENKGCLEISATGMKKMHERCCGFSGTAISLCRHTVTHADATPIHHTHQTSLSHGFLVIGKYTKRKEIEFFAKKCKKSLTIYAESLMVLRETLARESDRPFTNLDEKIKDFALKKYSG